MFQLTDLKPLTDLKQLDLTKLDLTKLDLTKLDPRKLDLTKLDLPGVELPALPKVDMPFELPKMELPKMELPKVDLPFDRLAGLARDAAYVGVGAAVVASKAASERRRAIVGTVSARVRRVVDAVA